MVKLLLSNGASVTPTTAVNYTPLHQAAQQGHNGIVSILLESQANPNATTNVSYFIYCNYKQFNTIVFSLNTLLLVVKINMN